jgi:SSS family solute:Na+ symporter
MGVIMCLVAKAMHMISGSNVGGVILLCGIIVIFYTYMAGIEGVIWTDVVQTLFLVIAGIACLLFVGAGLPDGFHSVREVLSHAKGGSYFDSAAAPLWMAFLYFLVAHCGFYMTNQAIAQRYLAGSSIRAAKRGTFMAAIVAPLAVGMFFAIGIALYVLYNGGGMAHLPAEISQDADKVFIYFITQSIPDGLKGLIIVGILSAAMSTVDSGINSGATVFISNIYHPHIKRGRGDAAPTMDVLRRSSLIFGVLGIAIAYFVFISGESVLDVYWRWVPVISTGIFGLFLLMRLSNKVGPLSGGIAVIVGASVTAWISFTGGKDMPFAAPFHFMLNYPVGLLSIVVTGLLCSLVFKRTAPLTREASCIEYDELTGEEFVERPVNTEYHLIKHNALMSALQPNAYYQLLGAGGVVFYLLLLFRVLPIALSFEDQVLMSIGCAASLGLLLTPVPQHDSQNKKHSIFVLMLLGLAFPLVGAIGFFAHPDVLFFNYFFMATIAVLGAFVEWAVLGFLVSFSACAATLIVSAVYPSIGIPGNWLALTSGCLGIMTLYAMSSARRSLHEREKLEGIAILSHTIASQSKGAEALLNRLVCDTADFLERGYAENDRYPVEVLSVRDCLEQAVQQYPFQGKDIRAVELKLDQDFEIKGNRTLLMNCFLHVIDNAACYIRQGRANCLVCRIYGPARKVVIEDNGPGVLPRNVPYIFELFFSAGKLGTGMGLTYCRSVLKLMGASIHLTSKPGDALTQFTITFPDEE